MGTGPSEQLAQAAAAINLRRDGLSSDGVRLLARVARRMTLRGITYELRLSVWPEVGFDDLAWVTFERSWTGTVRLVESVEGIEAKANRVLDAYAAGDFPPGQAFS